VRKVENFEIQQEILKARAPMTRIEYILARKEISAFRSIII